jgi:hypothetical protein
VQNHKTSWKQLDILFFVLAEARLRKSSRQTPCKLNNIHLKIARLYLEIHLIISIAPDRIEHLKQLPSRGRKQSTQKTGTAQEQREEVREQVFGHFAQILPSSSFFFFLGEFSH